MAERRSVTPITEAEYEAIEAAVMETARGRWFLAEFARRNRNADTQVLLEAIARLEHALAGERGHDKDRLRFDLMEMAKAISRTKTEIAAIRPPDQEQSRLIAASEALDEIVRTTERATSDILLAAEHVQEVAWTMREAGANEHLCNELDRRATDIYTACSFQDVTAHRTQKIVQTLHFLEGRIGAMIEIWGGDSRAPFDRPGYVGRTSTLNQSDVDIVIIDDDLFAAAADGKDGRGDSRMPPQTIAPIESERDAGAGPGSARRAEPPRDEPRRGEVQRRPAQLSPPLGGQQQPPKEAQAAPPTPSGPQRGEQARREAAPPQVPAPPTREQASRQNPQPGPAPERLAAAAPPAMQVKARFDRRPGYRAKPRAPEAPPAGQPSQQRTPQTAQAGPVPPSAVEPRDHRPPQQPEPPPAALEPFAEIDALDTREKLRRFT